LIAETIPFYDFDERRAVVGFDTVDELQPCAVGYKVCRRLRVLHQRL
jgi:hypothetical protein